MSSSKKKLLLGAMAVIVLLSACQPAQPTQNASDIANQVATSVALTVAAQNAQTQAAVSPTPVATNTTLPTQTSEVLPSPTLEPVIVVTDTPLGGSAFEPAIVITDTPRGTSPSGPPTIHRVTPNRGSLEGGTTVRIEGANLRGLQPTIVDFGPGNQASNIRCSPSACTVTSPKLPPDATERGVKISVIVDGVTSLPDLQGNDNFTYTEPVKYACDVFAQKPGYLAEIKAGDSFDIQWIIVNTGETTWPAGFDVKYSNGSKMTSTTVVEIRQEMKPNDRYTINLDAVAPNKAGNQYMTWVVEGQLCFPSVLINVVN